MKLESENMKSVCYFRRFEAVSVLGTWKINQRAFFLLECPGAMETRPMHANSFSISIQGNNLKYAAHTVENPHYKWMITVCVHMIWKIICAKLFNFFLHQIHRKLGELIGGVQKNTKVLSLWCLSSWIMRYIFCYLKWMTIVECLFSSPPACYYEITSMN